MREAQVPEELEALLRRTYAAFNARHVDAVLAAVQPDVDWPNALEGTRLRGHDAVREYWQRQFEMIDPRVEPQRFTLEPDGRVAVAVHQIVRDRAGNVLADSTVEHVYRLRDGLVEHMEIR
ncbi:MAG TPA: nuclear transport factor 2 family protein [Chloroflexota bacterium]|jgi:ketosteroid isomerase-like protein